MYKKLIYLTIFASSTLMGNVFAQDCQCGSYNYNQTEEESCPEVDECDQDYNYIKMGGGITGRKGDISPTVTFGKRFDRGDSAIDLSINFIGNNRRIFYALPKILYLVYLSPEADTSLYCGAGLSFGGTTGSSKTKFTGIQGELAVGYEFSRTKHIRTFVELNATQGIIPFNTKHKFAVNPAASLGFGIGF